MWVLSGLVTPVLAAAGLFFAASWVANDAPQPLYAAYGQAPLELMKSYFLVDLVYCAVFHWADTPLLDCWIHHLFYIGYLDWLGRTGQADIIQPYLIMEVPTAIRTVGRLLPSWRGYCDLLFVPTFAVLRIAWPIWVTARIAMAPFNFTVAIAMITLHCYWLGQMLWRFQRAALRVVRY
jgi:hypothetical protein